MNVKVRSLLRSAFLIGCLFVLVACSSEAGEDAARDPEGGSETSEDNVLTTTDPFSPFDEEISFSLARTNLPNAPFPSGDSLEDNEYTRYVKQALNVSVDYEWTAPSGETYDQRVNLAISSQSIPDVITVNEQQLRQLVESDLVEDLKTHLRSERLCTG